MRTPTRFLVLIAAGALAGCGAGGTSTATSTSTSTTSTATGSTATTSTASPTPAGPAQLVWAVTDASGITQVRTVTAAGGTPHVVTTTTANALVLAAGHGQVIWWGSGTLHVVAVGSSADTTIPFGSSGDTVLGGAISPDGGHFVAIDATDSTHAALREVDLGTKAVTSVRTITDNNLDVPRVWSSGGLAAVTVAGFSDSGAIARRHLDGTTFARTGTTTLPNSNFCGNAFNPAADHVALASHANLGDDGDSPGPAPNCNTLWYGALGSSPATALSEAHHSIAVLDVNDDGTILIDDQSAAGGFAGISTSGDFGLFTVHGTTKAQIATLGSEGDPAGAGLLLAPGAAVVASCPTSAGTCHLTAYHGSSPSPLDSVSGQGVVMVAVV